MARLLASRAGATFSFLLVWTCCSLLAVAQSPIPPRYDGFVFTAAAPREDSIFVEAFLDPICPDSRDTWPHLKQAVKHYSSELFLIVHPFPLPYHDNSFVACRALHIANKLNSSATYPLLELFFKQQDKYYNKVTQKRSRAYIINHVANLAAKVLGNSSLNDFQNGFEDPKTDRAARTSFNYGCSRGVIGTPSFFVNGFPLPGSGSAITYEKWRSIIDPLLNEQKQSRKEAMRDVYE